MDPQVAKLLEEDLKKARESRDSVKEPENYGVIGSKYLDPVTNEIGLSINHRDGVFMYFRRLVEVLEEARDNGVISVGSLPAGCPRWLEDLADEQEAL